MTGIRHRDHGPEGAGSMSTSHLALVAAPAIVGSKAAFSLCRLDWRNQYDCEKYIPIQDGELAFGFDKEDAGKGNARSDLVERTNQASVPTRNGLGRISRDSRVP